MYENVRRKVILWHYIGYSWREIWILNKMFYNLSILLKYLNSVTHSVVVFVLLRMLEVFSLLFASYELNKSLKSSRAKIYKTSAI
jgi:hypothetical protein